MLLQATDDRAAPRCFPVLLLMDSTPQYLEHKFCSLQRVIEPFRLEPVVSFRGVCDSNTEVLTRMLESTALVNHEIVKHWSLCLGQRFQPRMVYSIGP